MNALLVTLAVMTVCVCLASAGTGGYKGGGYKGGYKGGYNGGGDNYAAAPTPAPVTTPAAAAVPAPTPAPAERCISDGGGICAASCPLGTYTVEDTSYSCDGNGSGSVCCLPA